MRPEDLRKLLDRRPFVPFRIRMSDGSAHQVRHPEMALLGRSYLHIGVAEQTEKRIADEFEFCSLLHIVRIENINGAAAAQA